jgi:hypothetical protein
VSLLAQKPNDWIKYGDQAAEDGDWYAARHYYEEALQLDSGSFDIQLKYAGALRMVKDYKKAEYYYDKLFTKDRGQIYAEGQFWLAMMQKNNGDYSDALRNFKKFNKKVKRDKSSYLYLKSDKEIEACTWALNQRRNDTGITLRNIDAPVNTDESEFAPWLSSDSMLTFTALRQSDYHTGSEAQVQVYRSSFDSTFSQPSLIEDILEVGYQYANVKFGPGNTTVYFSRCDGRQNCDIYQAEVDGLEWYNVEPVVSVNKAGFSSSMPHVVLIAETPVMFFASNRAGGQGNMDIWWSEMIEGEFAAPVNAGFEINSADNEVSPFYSGGQLYFSSDWHTGFGGFDIFRSAGVPREFAIPENLGYPLNSQANDLYYAYNTELQTGLFASNRIGSYSLEGETCCNDIYMVQYEDSLNKSDDPYENLEDLNKYLPVTLYFHNDEPNPNSRDTTTTLSYLEAYDSYQALKGKYRNENSKGLKQEEKEDAEYEVDEFYEFFVDKGVSDLAIFTDLLLKELRLGTDVELIIRGFASPRAESDYNVNLTKRRTSSLVNYLSLYNGGELLPFMSDSSGFGSLTFIEIPYGEYEADSAVSDVLENEKASIYSRGARLERKIMIESVQRAKPTLIEESVQFDSDVHEFGKISSRFPVEHTFTFTNNSGDSLVIDSVKTECGCTVPTITTWELANGESTELHVVFDPEGKKGLVTKTVTLYTSPGIEPKLIRITAEVQ